MINILRQIRDELSLGIHALLVLIMDTVDLLMNILINGRKHLMDLNREIIEIIILWIFLIFLLNIL